MKEIINIKDLYFSFDDNELFNDLNVSIKSKRWLTIVGPNGSGKSTLVKLIDGVYNYQGMIDLKEKKMGVIYDYLNIQFECSSVLEELNSKKENLNYTEEEFIKKRDKLITAFSLKKVLDYNPNNLPNSYKVLINLSLVLMEEPKLIILDDTLDILDNIQKDKVLRVLKSFYKRGTTIISITHNIENSLIGDDILLLADGKVQIYTKKEEFFEKEKELKKYGIQIPFIVDLSHKLKYYDMVNDTYFDMEKLVDEVWK